MDANARATLIGAMIAGIVSIAGALLARYGKRDDTHTERQRLAEERRQKDLDRLYDGLRTTIADLQAEIKGCEKRLEAQDATIERLRLANADLYGEKQQLSIEVGRLQRRVAELEGKVG